MVAILAFLRDFLRLTFAMWLLKRTRGRPGEEPKSAIIGASAASPVLARSMPTLFVCMSSTDLYVCHRPTGRIAHAQKHAKHML